MTLDPATKLGVAVPLPPFATGSIPVTPVVRGKPIAFVSVPLAGVPSAGAMSVGPLLRTFDPLPVLLVTPVPPCETPRTPVMPPAAIAVAVMVPVPVVDMLLPLPTNIAAVVFVPLLNALKEGFPNAEVMAVRTAYSVGTFVLTPGDPSDVTTCRWFVTRTPGTEPLPN